MGVKTATYYHIVSQDRQNLYIGELQDRSNKAAVKPLLDTLASALLQNNNVLLNNKLCNERDIRNITSNTLDGYYQKHGIIKLWHKFLNWIHWKPELTLLIDKILSHLPSIPEEIPQRSPVDLSAVSTKEVPKTRLNWNEIDKYFNPYYENSLAGQDYLRKDYDDIKRRDDIGDLYKFIWKENAFTEVPTYFDALRDAVVRAILRAKLPENWKVNGATKDQVAVGLIYQTIVASGKTLKELMLEIITDMSRRGLIDETEKGRLISAINSDYDFDKVSRSGESIFDVLS